jgi:hypothetical protein
MKSGHKNRSDPIDAVALRTFFSQSGGVGFHESPQVKERRCAIPVENLISGTELTSVIVV